MSTSNTTVPFLFRNALAHYASGITVITAQHQGERVGFTCQSFYSVSITPPLISFSVMKTSASFPKIRESGRFAVNILSGDQQRLSDQFARRQTDKWEGIDEYVSQRGNPLIKGSLYWLECEIHAEHIAGDHIIVVGEVKEIQSGEGLNNQPLLYFKGQYCQLSETQTL